MKLKCKLCSHEWTPRNKIPIACPRCKRYDYQKDNLNKQEENNGLPNRT